MLGLLVATASFVGAPLRGPAPAHAAQRYSAPRLCAAAAGIELPLFDPRGDELPFPFPAPLPVGDEGFSAPEFYRYAFDRPVYVRMLRDSAEAAAADTERPAYIGHCVVAGDGEVVGALTLGDDTIVRVGTVGAAIRVGAIDVSASPGAIGDEVGVVSGVGAFRFVVEEIVRTIPYPVARVRELRDEPPADDAAAARAAAAETRVAAKLARLVELSERLEARGGASEQAERALAAPSEMLAAHERCVLGGLYADLGARFECFSLAACELVAMPYADTARTLSTTSAEARLELLLSHLEPALRQMETLASLDALDGGAGGLGLSGLGGGLGGPGGGLGGSAGAAPTTGAAAGADARSSMLGGTTAFTPIDIALNDIMGGEPLAAEALPDGARIEWWWDQELEWLAATVRGRITAPDGQLLHTLEFDMDGELAGVSLSFGDGGKRWRPLRADGSP